MKIVYKVDFYKDHRISTSILIVNIEIMRFNMYNLKIASAP